MIRAGYFATAGHTETGGLQSFLTKLLPGVDWVRRFPAVKKPAPKYGRADPTPAAALQGTTGDALVTRMLANLDLYRADDLDFVLLVDDADCRFASPNDLPAWKDRIADAVTESAGRALPLFTLLAAPEVETWLLADWEEGFRAQYPRLAVALRRHLETCVGLDWGELESYGGGKSASGCRDKLSQALSDAVAAGGDCDDCRLKTVAASMVGQRYSKQHDGAAMLKRVRPERVRKACKLYFAGAYVELQAFRASPSLG